MNEDKYILAVDDNQENLRILSSLLRDEGYKIALALNGENALKILEDNDIDLILLDIMMPIMDGFEVQKKIKENPKTKNIPVIFITAKNQTDDLVDGFKAGAVDYMSKPFKKDELLMRVKTHLELAGSRKKIIEMNRTRDKLYSIIAHDIRSPLSGITQTIDAISNGFLEMGSDDFMKIFNLLKQRTTETTTLLNNLLEWTKLHSDNISLFPKLTNIHIILSECLYLLKGNVQNKNIIINLNIPESTIAFFDEVTMHTAFRNIISNAIKFTPDNGTISIDTEDSGDFVSISIKDTGIGMSEEIINKIFNQNTHYTSLGTKNEMGTGLGLFLVKDFVYQNNGKIIVESKPGLGTNFIVFLPKGSD
ncbi:MAG: hybrid sensor histidine kinase/response regulator [Bacteroidetes bacterium]|nr:hybrid sensor histidine kinase/response regulator [Bacteroidota bacterium]